MANEAPKVKVGGKVNLVLHNGNHLAAEVTKVRSGNLIDLKTEHRGQPVEITSSPFDGEGKRPDSWHPVPEEAPADLPKDQAK
jgi:hypothetical protein